MPALRSTVSLLGALLLGACSSMSTLTPEAIAEMSTAGKGQAEVRVHLVDGRATAFDVPIALDDLPAAVRSAAERELLDGEWLRISQRWQGSTGGNFVLLRGNDMSDYSHVVVATDGELVERSHGIPLDKAPEPVREALAGEPGELQHLTLVHYGDFHWYRARLQIDGQESFAIDVDASGEVKRRAQRVPAEIWLQL